MVDVNPEIWSNPTLGAAANGVFLDVMEAQIAENRAAEIEGRPAQIIKRDNRYPGFEVKNPHSMFSECLPGLSYEDGAPVSAPQGGPEVPAQGAISAAQKAAQPPSTPRSRRAQ